MNDRDIQQLFSLRNEYRSLRYDLGNIRVLCRALGNPQREFRSVLIAGTNGKGSVARILSAIVPAAGLYVSPHLERLNERISIGGWEIDDEALGQAFETVRAASESVAPDLLYPPTFFERVTAMAFCFFRDRVDHAILEVGLGGRLDATNIVRQDLSIITSLALDHQEHLGSTLDEIAGEKAGIIKDSEPVVIGPGCGLGPVRERAQGRLVDARSVRADVRALGHGYFEIDLATQSRRYPGLRPRLAGRHQIENLKLAVCAAEYLEACGWPLDAESIRRGANEAVVPGRLEPLGAAPRFLLDGAHNVEAAWALRRFLEEYHPHGVALVFGSMREKDSVGMLSVLGPCIRKLILTRPSNERAADPAPLERLFAESVVTDNVGAALEAARRYAGPADTAVVTGSLYLVGEARGLLRAGGVGSWGG